MCFILHVLFEANLSKSKYILHSWRGGSVVPSQPRCATAAMPKADASWSTDQCQYLGNSILESAGVKKLWGSHYLWNHLNEVFPQVLSSLFLPFQTGMAPKMTILFCSTRMTPHAGSLSPSLLIVCVLKTPVSQGRDRCLTLAQNAKQRANWFLTNTFKRRKENSVFNV